MENRPKLSYEESISITELLHVLWAEREKEGVILVNSSKIGLTQMEGPVWRIFIDMIREWMWFGSSLKWGNGEKKSRKFCDSVAINEFKFS